jgi:hypothetical protein
MRAAAGGLSEEELGDARTPCSLETPAMRLSGHVMVGSGPDDGGLRQELGRGLSSDEVPTHVGVSRDGTWGLWRFLIRGRDAAARRVRLRAQFWTEVHWQLLRFERQGHPLGHLPLLELLERSQGNVRAAFARRFELSVEGTYSDAFRADLRLSEADVWLGRCERCYRGLRTCYVKRSRRACAGCKLPESGCRCLPLASSPHPPSRPKPLKTVKAGLSCTGATSRGYAREWKCPAMAYRVRAR